jgi:hypothetical protein
MYSFYQLLPGPLDLSYYTCAGLDPTSDLALPTKPEGVILLVSAIFQLIVNARIAAVKNHEKLKKLQEMTQTRRLCMHLQMYIGMKAETGFLVD